MLTIQSSHQDTIAAFEKKKKHFLTTSQCFQKHVEKRKYYKRNGRKWISHGDKVGKKVRLYKVVLVLLFFFQLIEN